MSPSCRIISSVGRTNSIVSDDQGLVVSAEKFGPKTQAAGRAQVAYCEGVMTMIEDGFAEFQAGLTAIGEVFA
jgi:hypothetical protein